MVHVDGDATGVMKEGAEEGGMTMVDDKDERSKYESNERIDQNQHDQFISTTSIRIKKVIIVIIMIITRT